MKGVFFTTISALIFCLNIVGQNFDLQLIRSPVIFRGDSITAYRDPAILFHDDLFYLFFTLIEIEPDGRIYGYTAKSKSGDLVNWETPKKITPRDQKLNFSSPGNIIRFRNEWVLCFQTYPRPGYAVDQMPAYGNKNARIFTIRSADLELWTEPELLKVKGPSVPENDMGRMIDPYLVEDKNEPGKYWCFYKQNGVSMSWSYDLKVWTYYGRADAGENVCVLRGGDQYILFHSPNNGIGIKKTTDLKNWEDWGDLITLGQHEWPWAKGRITAGAVLDMRSYPGINKYVMFFHGSGPETEQEGDFDKNCSIGIAWSEDLINWQWP